ncbi:MAG: hypothetical protein QNM02_10635 [Acidimicrobiia bacterium]|nr:hypothetical protein [Acidimicrobiia bacterium]
MILLTNNATTTDAMMTDLACQIRGCTVPGSPRRIFVAALG